MPDPNDLLGGATTEAMLAAGKNAARRAALDLLSSDEERAAREAEEAKAAKKRRYKLIAVAVLGLSVLIGVIGMLVSYWHWFLLLGVGGIAALLAWRWGAARLAARKERAGQRVDAVAVEAKKVETKAATRVAEPATPARLPADDALAEAEASADAVEEELAALKARLQQSRRG